MDSALANVSCAGQGQDPLVLITLMRCTLATHFSLGFALNGYIIVLLLSKGGAVGISVIFVLNNSAAEILLSILSLIYMVFMEHAGPTFATLSNFIFGSSMSARLLFLCCVSLERYLAVVHPVTFLRFKPLRYRVACSVSVWMCALVLGAGASMNRSAFKVLVAANIIVLVVEFFCCVAVLEKLRRPGPRDAEQEQGEMSATKKKAFQVVAINLLACLVQSGPIVFSYSLESVLSCYDFTIATAVCTTVNIFVGFVQPLFILHKLGKLAFMKCS